jgi:hypothetical protein
VLWVFRGQTRAPQLLDTRLGAVINITSPYIDK